MDRQTQNRTALAIWLSALLPIMALAGMLAFFLLGNPLAPFTADPPPIELLDFGRVRVVDEGFKLSVVNEGPDPVRISQVLVDEAYWEFDSNPLLLDRYQSAELTVYYPWVYGEPHEIRVITQTGVTFDTEVELAIPTPVPGFKEFLAYGLLGIYVGIIPVGLGMLWFPALRRVDRKWLDAVLALTIGLLVFLFVDTFLEGLEVAEGLPEFFQGTPLVVFAALITWLVLMAVRASGEGDAFSTANPMGLARLIALSIGLHNLGEGLAIGAAFALGEAALGSFLVVGFTLHNITEGVGIAAPLLPHKRSDDEARKGSIKTLLPFVWLVLLAGAPAILGAWIGGFAYSPLLSTLFLGIGVGAIWQVIVEVAGLLQRNAARASRPTFSWLNVAGFTLGLTIMYVTAFLVSF
jgi:zinc transporter ZupT